MGQKLKVTPGLPPTTARGEIWEGAPRATLNRGIKPLQYGEGQLGFSTILAPPHPPPRAWAVLLTPDPLCSYVDAPKTSCRL